MTHDELLAKIDAFTGVKYYVENNQITYSNVTGNWLRTNQALRAVVELHKPFTKVGSAQFKEIDICTAPSCADGLGMLWPCETIKAIEKELA